MSTPLAIVESRVIDGLRNWLQKYELEYPAVAPQDNTHTDVLRAAITAKEKELDTLTAQKVKAFDLLEQGVYTVETFSERSRDLADRISAAQKDIDCLTDELSRADRQAQMERDTVPHVRTVLQAYDSAPTAAEKNRLLQEILDHATYKKDKSGAFRGVSVDDFELEIFPKLPKG